MTITITYRSAYSTTLEIYHDDFDRASVIDALEDALYILHEITPIQRDWMHEMVSGTPCLFEYGVLASIYRVDRIGETEFQVVEIDG